MGTAKAQDRDIEAERVISEALVVLLTAEALSQEDNPEAALKGLRLLLRKIVAVQNLGDNRRRDRFYKAIDHVLNRVETLMNLGK